jgi:hypothetical protein
LINSIGEKLKKDTDYILDDPASNGIERVYSVSWFYAIAIYRLNHGVQPFILSDYCMVNMHTASPGHSCQAQIASPFY